MSTKKLSIKLLLPALWDGVVEGIVAAGNATPLSAFSLAFLRTLRDSLSTVSKPINWRSIPERFGIVNFPR